ncbi:hypothetical protein SAMN05192559_101811 [Halobacillus karajensis]|nr:hypothetical protein SAMN05192559_101811 [Halobacillus karajensis]
MNVPRETIQKISLELPPGLFFMPLFILLNGSYLEDSIPSSG